MPPNNTLRPITTALDASHVQALEARLPQVQRDNDVPTLDALLATDLLLSDLQGNLVTAHADLDAHRNRLLQLTGAQVLHQHTTLPHAATAIAYTLAHMVGTYDD